MDSIWIVVANHTRARIFERPGFRSALGLVRDIGNPEGRMKARDIDTDRPGRYQGTAGRQTPGTRVSSSGGHGYSPRMEPAERSAREFSQRLAGILHDAKARNQLGGIILIADRRFLGLLRDALDRPTMARVLGSLDKNLVNLSEEELERQLEAILAEVDARSPFLQSAS